MKIERFIKDYSEELEDTIIEIVDETVQSIWQDVKNKAPIDTGEYISSITYEPTHKTKKGYAGSVYSDYTVTTKNGEEYLLGELLENGTDPHAIPNAFGWGDIYGYDSPQYERTTRPDWHPGMLPQPHWQPAYDNANDKIDRLLKEKL